MKYKLTEIANVQTGVFTTPGLEPDVLYLQVKHFDDEGMLTRDITPELKMTGKLERHLLVNGDVLLASKGTRFFASSIGKDLGPAVASSSFMIIRLKEDWQKKLLPPYLTWYLNQPECLNIIKSSSRGSSLPSVPKSAVEELLVPVPTIARQQTIMNIQTLRNQQKSLEQKLQDLNDQILHNHLIISANTQ